MIQLLLILQVLFSFNSCGISTRTDNLKFSQMELFSYLPENTDYMFYADLNKINGSTYGAGSLASLLPDITDPEWMKNFEKATGTGIGEGIKEIVIVKTKDNDNILLARFDSNYYRVRDYFRESSEFQRTSVKNIFSLRKKPDTKVYCPEENLLIVSARGEYIDSLAAGRIKSIQKNHTIWIATDKGVLAGVIFDYLTGKDSKLLSSEILSSTKSFCVSARFSDGIEIESVPECSNAGNAYLLAAEVEGAVAMNILSKKSYKPGKIFDKINVNREGRLIRFHPDLKVKELDVLKQLALNEKKGDNLKGEIW